MEIKQTINQLGAYAIKRYCSKCGKEYDIVVSIAQTPKGAAEAKSR